MKDQKTFQDELNTFVEGEDGKEYVAKHLVRFYETASLIPNEKKLNVLDIGTFIPLAAYLQDNTKHTYTLHGIWEKGKAKTVKTKKRAFKLYNFNAETDRFPFKDGSFDVVLCGEVLEHLGLDPMYMISEINRVLKKNGLLILTTPNITSLRSLCKMILGYSPYLYASFTLTPDRHNREYSPREIRLLFEKGGFRIQKLYTSNTYFEGSGIIKDMNPLLKVIIKLFVNITNTTRMRGDCIL